MTPTRKRLKFMQTTRRNILKSMAASLAGWLPTELLSSVALEDPPITEDHYAVGRVGDCIAIQLKKPAPLTRPRFQDFLARAHRLERDLMADGFWDGHDLSIHVDRKTASEFLVLEHADFDEAQPALLGVEALATVERKGYPFHIHQPTDDYHDMLEIRIIPRTYREGDAYLRDFFVERWKVNRQRFHRDHNR